ncbi:MAG TPA: FAD binding domain-containing protein [Anaerovoracaceae bacterium]|nr:FAD binding domain-containing protein [Anaerovoracaceae bacterium]
MIPYNFEYYQPDSLSEAVNLYDELSSMNMQPVYYAGGTEIITMARTNELKTKAVIDIKQIPECRVFAIEGNALVVGASISLTQLREFKSFPVLSETAGFPADHTSRNKITVIGNICGSIQYKEAVLGYMVTDSNATIYGKNGRRVLPINEAFDKRLRIEKGELVCQLATDMSGSKLPNFCIKKTKQGVGGYPLISMAALKKDNRIRMAFSGLCDFPFRSEEMEEDINHTGIPKELRIKLAISHVPGPILDDIQGSAEYRKFVLSNLLEEILAKLDGESL